MKLYYAPTSPFARKVRVITHQLDLAERVELVMTDPWTSEELRRLNPLAKVPTLVCDDGTVLIESDVICDYLDALAAGEGRAARRMIPQAGAARWTALRRQAIADGLCMAAGRLYADEQRPETERSFDVMHRQRQVIADALSHLRREASALDPTLGDIGAVSVACALDYFGFRWPGSTGWRTAHASLAAWFDAAGTLPEMQATAYYQPESRVKRLRAGY
jgi:glutathione S-transferase